MGVGKGPGDLGQLRRVREQTGDVLQSGGQAHGTVSETLLDVLAQRTQLARFEAFP
jgi:RNA-binding protein YlmH